MILERDARSSRVLRPTARGRHYYLAILSFRKYQRDPGVEEVWVMSISKRTGLNPRGQDSKSPGSH